MDKFYVYELLYKEQRVYIGFTQNIEKRLKSHVEDFNKTISGKKHFTTVYIDMYNFGINSCDLTINKLYSFKSIEAAILMETKLICEEKLKELKEPKLFKNFNIKIFDEKNAKDTSLVRKMKTENNKNKEKYPIKLIFKTETN